jgi:hypothetical protein
MKSAAISEFKKFKGYGFYGFDWYAAKEVRRFLLLNIPKDMRGLRILESHNIELAPKIIARKNFEHLAMKETNSDYIGLFFEQNYQGNSIAWLSGGLNFLKNKGSFCYSYFSENSELDVKLKNLAEGLQSLLQRNGLSYGYLFDQSNTSDPASYPFGQNLLNHHKKTTAQPLKYWSSAISLPTEQCPYRHGIMRDIYSVNFINLSHMGPILNGKSILQLISLEPIFGVLNQLEEELWKWSIEPCNLNVVRLKLANSSLLSLPYFLAKLQKNWVYY